MVVRVAPLYVCVNAFFHPETSLSRRRISTTNKKIFHARGGNSPAALSSARKILRTVALNEKKRRKKRNRSDAFGAISARIYAVRRAQAPRDVSRVSGYTHMYINAWLTALWSSVSILSDRHIAFHGCPERFYSHLVLIWEITESSPGSCYDENHILLTFRKYLPSMYHDVTTVVNIYDLTLDARMLRIVPRTLYSKGIHPRISTILLQL